jgi:hypothetical protein
VSSQYKSEFFSNMSHELRTPLNSLLILAGELEDNPEQNLTPAQVEYASVIRSSGNDLLRLLNDILDLAKVESGTVTLQISDLPLVELQDVLERDFVHIAEQQGLSFSVELAPGLPPDIATDPGRLRQVLKNLLANAFKFTESGEVRVLVSRAEDGWTPGNNALARAGAVIAFRIADTGIGIAPDMQRRIFEAFAQADGTSARQYGGTGLGLSISLELVRLLGGEIALSSTPDHGSIFTVYLPSAFDGDAAAVAAAPAPEAPALQPVEAPELLAPALNGDAAAGSAAIDVPGLAAPAPSLVSPAANGDAAGAAATPDAVVLQPLTRPEHPAGAHLGGMKALVVDDDFRNILALTALLERVHLDVVSAESGEEAIEVLKQTPDIDIVLVDIMMPGIDGYATMRAMRKGARGAELPLVAFTAKVEEGERQRCIDAGASAYVPKPVDMAALLLLLGEWLPASTRGRQLPAAPG